MKSYYLLNKIKRIKCPKHFCEITQIDLSKISQDGTRVMCENCAKIDGSVTVQGFDEICKQLRIKKQSLIDNIRQQYQQKFEQIQHLIQSFDQIVRKQIFNVQNEQMLQQVLEKAFSPSDNQYALKEFEILAQFVAQDIESKEINDQKQAEASQYLELTQQLLSLISSHFKQHNITEIQAQISLMRIDEKILDQNKLENFEYFERQEKIVTESFSHITGLYLNFDETLLAARFTESTNSIQFWRFVEDKKQWSPHAVLKCHGESLIDFSFSKIQNFFITTGLDLTEKKKGNWNQQTFSIKKWDLLGDNKIFLYYQENKFYEANNKRIQCMAQNSQQSLLIAGQGGSIIIFTFQNNKYIQELVRQISSEIISVLSFSEAHSSFSIGTYNKKIFICSFDDKKFKIIQQWELQGVPKQIIFGNENLELFILFKDGILSISMRDNVQAWFRETQRIVNNIEKIRAIELSNLHQVLAIGGETNELQIWKRNDNMQWKCQSQYQQDNFINCICFSHLHKQIISSNNVEIYIHRF